MNRTLKIIAPAIAMALAAAPAAFAQGSTQSPPSPNASSSAPAPATSAPPTAMTSGPGSMRNPNTTGALNGNGMPAGGAGNPSAAMSTTVPMPATK